METEDAAGASLRIVAPTGQYDPTKLVNWGINRWAFKPEFGYSQRWGNWMLDGYAGVWFYTTNPAYFDIPIPQPQTEAPVGSLEGHLSYDFPRWGIRGELPERVCRLAVLVDCKESPIMVEQIAIFVPGASPFLLRLNLPFGK